MSAFDNLDADLKRTACCGADNKPPKSDSYFCGQCEFCGRIWCKVNTSCKMWFVKLSRFLAHEAEVDHAEEVILEMGHTEKPAQTASTVEKCSYCGTEKDKSQPLFGICSPRCSRFYCMFKGCDKEFSLSAPLSILDEHYQTVHNEDIPFQKFSVQRKSLENNFQPAAKLFSRNGALAEAEAASKVKAMTTETRDDTFPVEVKKATENPVN